MLEKNPKQFWSNIKNNSMGNIVTQTYKQLHFSNCLTLESGSFIVYHSERVTVGRVMVLNQLLVLMCTRNKTATSNTRDTG